MVALLLTPALATSMSNRSPTIERLLWRANLLLPGLPGLPLSPPRGLPWTGYSRPQTELPERSGRSEPIHVHPSQQAPTQWLVQFHGKPPSPVPFCCAEPFLLPSRHRIGYEDQGCSRAVDVVLHRWRPAQPDRPDNFSVHLNGKPPSPCR